MTTMTKTMTMNSKTSTTTKTTKISNKILHIDWKCENCNSNASFTIDAKLDPEAIFNVALGMHSTINKFSNIKCLLREGCRMTAPEKKVPGKLGFLVILK